MARAKTPTKSSSAKADADPVAGHCNAPPRPPRPVEPGLHPNRMFMVLRLDTKWVNHTVLHYCFLDTPALWRGSNADKDVVRDSFQAWKDLPIGLDFVEVTDPREAEIRIGFQQNAGSWSYLGRVAIDYITDPAERTMNFGWDLTTPYGRDTAMHEIGHALGFSHEHQNPKAGIVWDEEAVYDYFTGPPNNWSREETDTNVLSKLPSSETDGSDWDPNSIMHYHFQAGLILSPEEYRTSPLIPEPGLSATDIATAKALYPAPENPDLPELRPYESHQLRIDPGEQVDFVIRPEFSRDYTIQTFGRMDTVMVLFEDINGEPHYVQGDDDSGFSLNAKITQRLFRGRTYYIRLRLYYAEAQGEGALMMY
ncbi:M12 family metallopeptidase [Marinibacterium profundimaris]|uniref:M12 family metallopeptidase n=1 Tax=Marinibacterium profundimaris TaxID=1679460 RepID=UPI000B52310C|nr:M12 family metallopeptidase [Marinibacterium profundimaris]